jgi:hypothetical protein
VWGQWAGVGVREGRQGSASNTGAPGLTPAQSQKAQSPTAHPMGGRPGQSCTSRGCVACPHRVSLVIEF